jgi:cation diffusion facilitator family transporter
LAINIQQPPWLLILSLAVTAAIAVVEVVGGILSNSISLVSDAVHVFTDVMAITLSLFAITLAARSHSGTMTFGYHRAEVLAALANGVALSAISVWVLYEAVLRVMSPRLIDAPLMLTAAGIGLAGNIAVMFMLKHHAGKSINVERVRSRGVRRSLVRGSHHHWIHCFCHRDNDRRPSGSVSDSRAGGKERLHDCQEQHPYPARGRPAPA